MLLLLLTTSFGLFSQSDSVRDIESSAVVQLDSSVENGSVAAPAQKSSRLKEANERPSENKTGLFLLCLLIFLLFGLLRFFHPRYITGLFKVYSQGQMLNKSALSQLQSNNAPKILFTVIYFITSGYVSVKIFYYFSGQPICNNDLGAIGLGILILAMTFLAKYTIVSLLAWVFNFRKGIKGLFHYLNFANQIVGIILLPICGILLLCLGNGSTIVLILGLITLAISLIVRYIYNFAYLKQLPNVNIFHFILYLCAFEIIPIAVLGRFVVNNL